MRNLRPVYYHANHTSCDTYFCMTGDFNPNTIMELLSLEPETSWKTGDTRKNGISKYDFFLLTVRHVSGI